jgi:hypothetical protein
LLRGFFSPEGYVFAHEVCDGSVRDKDARWIFLSVSWLTRKNRKNKEPLPNMRVFMVFV